MPVTRTITAMRAQGRCGLVLAAALTLTACADQSPPRGGTGAPPSGYVELRPMPEAPAPEALAPYVLPPDELLEDLAFPPMTVGIMEALDQVRAAAGDSPDFGDPEVSTDRTRITVRWHGPLPAAVQQVVDAYATADFEVVVEQTRFRPGDLRAEATRLITEHPGVVTGVGPRPAGDGLDVMIDDRVVEEAGGLDEALAEHGVDSRFPLFPSAGSITAAIPA